MVVESAAQMSAAMAYSSFAAFLDRPRSSMFVASSRGPSQSPKGSTLCTWSELVVRELGENFVLDNTPEWSETTERGAWRPLVGKAFPAGVAARTVGTPCLRVAKSEPGPRPSFISASEGFIEGVRTCATLA